jgi:hypothetical protein
VIMLPKNKWKTFIAIPLSLFPKSCSGYCSMIISSIATLPESKLPKPR